MGNKNNENENEIYNDENDGCKIVLHSTEDDEYYEVWTKYLKKINDEALEDEDNSLLAELSAKIDEDNILWEEGIEVMNNETMERRVTILEGMKIFPGIPNVPRTIGRMLKRNRIANPNRSEHEIIDLTIMQVKMGHGE